MNLYIEKVKKNRSQSLQNIINNLSYFRNIFYNCFGKDFGEDLIYFYERKLQKNQKKSQQQIIIELQTESVKENNKIDNLGSILLKALSQSIQNITVKKIEVYIEEIKQTPNIGTAIITIDDILILVYDNRISKQVDLHGVILQLQKCDNFMIGLRTKGCKSRSHIRLKFDSEERMDQFLLHIEKINQIS